MFIQKRLCDKAFDCGCVCCMHAHHCPLLVTHVPLLTTNRELYHEGHGFRSGIISDFDEAQELVTVRVFNFAGAWSYSFKLEELVKLTFEKPQQFFLYPRQGEKSRAGDEQGPAAPVLASASTDENLEEPKLIFAQCVTCEKFRYLPPSLPFAPIIKKISFTCQLKTGQQGCAAPFDEMEQKHMNLQEQEFT